MTFERAAYISAAAYIASAYALAPLCAVVSSVQRPLCEVVPHVHCSLPSSNTPHYLLHQPSCALRVRLAELNEWTCLLRSTPLPGHRLIAMLPSHTHLHYSPLPPPRRLSSPPFLPLHLVHRILAMPPPLHPLLPRRSPLCSLSSVSHYSSSRRCSLCRCRPRVQPPRPPLHPLRQQLLPTPSPPPPPPPPPPLCSCACA